MFAEDVGLLPDGYFSGMIDRCTGRNAHLFAEHASTLFAAMRTGGKVGFDKIEWFNGGLFDTDEALELTYADIDDLKRAAHLDWSDIDPSIMGTLFERGLDPDKRSQLGAHYTDRDKIMMIVTPVIDAPLRAEWAGLLAKIDAVLAAGAKNARDKAEALHAGFVDRLVAFRILDPACGSGNFLSIALQVLKQIEHQANLDCFDRGLTRQVLRTGPENMLGIELNPYAAELARVSVWIGDIQWSRRNGFEPARNPILRSLDTIWQGDALLKEDGTSTAWPKADVLVGNPPFLGGKIIRNGRRATKKRPAQKGLGDAYVDTLFAAYKGKVKAESDFVCYWFAKAWEGVADGTYARVGLVATNSIRGGANRTVLSQVAKAGRIFDAWSDEDWMQDGAAVRVSIVCFGLGGTGARLNGSAVAEIFADLTARKLDGAGTDLTKSARLLKNRGVAFMGDTKGGAFDVVGDRARDWLSHPVNPNGRSNADVLRPWINGLDLTRRPSDKWIIDFGWTMTEGEAALYEAPFSHILINVQPERANNKREAYQINWWRHVEARQGMWKALENVQRFIATPTVARHRLFRWVLPHVCPDHQLIAIARDDDTTFGILHSRFHELWALRMGTSLEDRPLYTPSTTFETFPFPEGLTPDIPAEAYADDPRAVAIAAAAAELNRLRENWLNPSDLIRRVPEVVPGYPDRLLPVDDRAAAELRKRTLTNLYNQRPTWLANAHRDLDRAVAEAYGWGAEWQAGMTEDEILARLFRLNQARAGVGKESG